MKELYLEIVAAMEKNGVQFGKDTYQALLHSLFSGQYYLKRTKGEITTFGNYWLIEARDGGNIAFIVDCFNSGGRKELMNMIKHFRRTIPEVNGVMWYHKAQIFDKFRFYPSQRGL